MNVGMRYVQMVAQSSTLTNIVALAVPSNLGSLDLHIETMILSKSASSLRLAIAHLGIQNTAAQIAQIGIRAAGIAIIIIWH